MNATISEQAVQWWLTVRESPHDAAVQQAFDAWLAQGDAQRMAYLDVLLAANAALPAAVPAERRVVPMASARHRRIGPMGFGALWATAATLALWFGPRLSEQWQADVRAAPGRVEAVTLADGSAIELGPDGAIAVSLDDRERRITVLRGQVEIAVAPDPRPLTVFADDARIRDIGTRFTVDRSGHTLRVGVAEGRVEVSRNGQTESLGAGERIDWTGHDRERGAWQDSRDSADVLLLDDARAEQAFARWAAWRGLRVTWIGHADDARRLDAALPMADAAAQDGALTLLSRHFRVRVLAAGGGRLLLRAEA